MAVMSQIFLAQVAKKESLVLPDFNISTTAKLSQLIFILLLAHILAQTLSATTTFNISSWVMWRFMKPTGMLKINLEQCSLSLTVSSRVLLDASLNLLGIMLWYNGERIGYIKNPFLIEL